MSILIRTTPRRRSPSPLVHWLRLAAVLLAYCLPLLTLAALLLGVV